MAIFPDRIVQKNSTDSPQTVRTEIDPVIGSDPIIGGELVIQRSIGGAQLFTLDSLNSPVIVGVSASEGAVAPSILLNFEEDGTDTPYQYVAGGIPFDTSGKFGKCFKHEATLPSPRINPLRVAAEDMPVLGSAEWTFSFWFKSDFTSDFYTGSVANTLLVASASDYVHGPGAFTVTIDGGTSDAGGIGTATSRTADLAKGAIVFGLGGMYGPTENTDTSIPSTGEIVTSANTGVCDNDWHYITFSHEGSGVYSCFIDGDLKERNIVNAPINHSLPGASGLVLPTGLEFGGALQINDNTPFPGTEFNGFNGRLDGVTLHAGIAIYRGLREFATPTAPPTDVEVQQPLDSLRRLIDTNIDLTPTNGDTIVYNATEGFWENAPAPAFNISGNNIGDLGDVNIAPIASIAQGEALSWDAVTSRWVNTPVLIENTDVDVSLISVGSVIRHDGSTGWKSERLNYSDLNGAPQALSDLNQDLDLGNYNLVDLGDVAISNLLNGDVLVWNASTNQFENITAPPANISTNLFADLSDVRSFAEASEATSETNIWLHWNQAEQAWEPEELDYGEITNRPTHLSQFSNNLNISAFPNDSNYITIGGLNGQSVGVFGDVTITSPVESHVLVYRSGKWRNEFGPPANISSNSIGDLSDVTRTQLSNTSPATVTLDDTGHLVFDSPQAATNITYQVMYSDDYDGVGLSAIRDSDDTGSEVFVSRAGGIDLRSDVNYVRLNGKPGVTTNRPELRFETGDSFATPATGRYISLKMPATVLEDQIYYLPQEDGDVGDVLATNGVGELAWVARVQNNELGQLTDVDLVTQLPVQGSSLVYNSAAAVWVPGAPAIDLSTTVLDDISDVSYGGTPGTGQALLWSGSAWVPGDISVTSTIIDSDDIGTAPTAGQFLVYDGTNFNGVTLADVATTNDYGDLDNLPTLFSGDYDDLTNLPTLFSGDYDDLSNKPTIPSTANDLSDVDTVTTAPVVDQALVWDGSNWVPGDVASDEASPAIVWTVDSLGSLSYSFTGSGFSAAAQNPDLYVVRGQKYTFDKVTTNAHPFELRDGANAQYTDGVVGLQPVSGVGTLEWVVPMDAPDELFYQCTAHPQMRGTIYVVGAGVDLASSNIEELANVSASAPVVGQALVWDGTEWVPGTVVSGNGTTGSAISQATTETQTTGTSGELTFIDLGTSGTLVSIEADAAAWVTIYSAAALRTADASRAFADDPAQGSGVLAEFVLPASTAVLTTPSTNYFNSEPLVSESIYALVRDASTGLVMDGVAVTVKAFAISGFTAISGGTFGSG